MFLIKKSKDLPCDILKYNHILWHTLIYFWASLHIWLYLYHIWNIWLNKWPYLVVHGILMNLSVLVIFMLWPISMCCLFYYIRYDPVQENVLCSPEKLPWCSYFMVLMCCPRPPVCKMIFVHVCSLYVFVSFLWAVLYIASSYFLYYINSFLVYIKMFTFLRYWLSAPDVWYVNRENIHIHEFISSVWKLKFPS